MQGGPPPRVEWCVANSDGLNCPIILLFEQDLGTSLFLQRLRVLFGPASCFFGSLQIFWTCTLIFLRGL